MAQIGPPWISTSWTIPSWGAGTWGYIPTPPQVAGGSSPVGYTRKRTTVWRDDWRAETKEQKEMRLSEILATKLADAIADNNAMMRINNNLLQANSNLLGVVSEIKGAKVVKTMDEDKKAELLARLAAGKEKARLEKEARDKEMKKRMAKARKAKQRR